jgi:DNA modification methylase
VADNRLAEKAGWDREILAIELQELIEQDFEVELTGFKMGEIDVILDQAEEEKREASGPEDHIPEPLAGVSVSVPGDLWILGAHRLLCADARESSSYDRLLNGEKAVFAFTDPPYNIPIDGNVRGFGRIHYREFAMGCGEMTRETFTLFLATVFRHLSANMADRSIHHICMDWRHMSEMLAAGSGVYSELKNLCVWNKAHAGMGSFYRSKHKLVFVWKSGTAPHVNNFELGQYGRTRTNVWDYPSINTTKSDRLSDLALHPTVKPVALVADAIKDCSKRGSLVLDPFCGSGTVLIAAERTGRKARAMEIDPEYVDVALRRWQAYTGKTAVLTEHGETFEVISEQRSASRLAVMSAPTLER